LTEEASDVGELMSRIRDSHRKKNADTKQWQNWVCHRQFDVSVAANYNTCPYPIQYSIDHSAGLLVVIDVNPASKSYSPGEMFLVKDVYEGCNLPDHLSSPDMLASLKEALHVFVHNTITFEDYLDEVPSMICQTSVDEFFASRARWAV
jgi:hypothetical protein